MPQAKSHKVVVCVFISCILFLIHILISQNAIAVQISGIVVNAKDQPVDKAIVRLQSTSLSTLTNQDGRFSLTAPVVTSFKHITAWKSGYYNGGEPIGVASKDYRIVLRPLALGDNLHYRWLPSFQKEYPGLINEKAKEMACQNCHPLIMEEWADSSHARSASNSFFLTFYNGTDNGGNNITSPGYRLDFPNSNGNCTTCHIPAQAVTNPFNSDANLASGVSKEGIFCDLCHKIDSTRIDTTGGYPGILSINFRRPAEDHQIFNGPYDDVFPGDDAYHPLYKTSNYCAPCHNGSFWNIPVYSEYQEWAESDYAKRNIHCQTCHMKSDGKMNRFALEERGGIVREPLNIPSHTNFGIGDAALNPL